MIDHKKREAALALVGLSNRYLQYVPVDPLRTPMLGYITSEAIERRANESLRLGISNREDDIRKHEEECEELRREVELLKAALPAE